MYLANSFMARLISYKSTHQDYFEEAFQLAISEKQPYAWRAAWLLWSIMDVNDPRIQGYINDMTGVI